MVRITLTSEQKERLRQDGSIDIVDSDGKLITTVNWEDTNDFVEDMKRRIAASRDKPKVTGRQVLEHLAALEKEWQRTGGFDKEYALRFVDDLRGHRCENR